MANVSPPSNPAPLALVTGATGALGPVLLRQLLTQGYRVRVLLRRAPPLGLPPALQLVQGDLNDRLALQRAVAGVDVVLHLAAKLHINNPDPALRAEYEQINVAGTHLLAETAQAAGVQRLVFCSSIAVYGATRGGPVLDEQAPLRPESLYAETKCRAEEIVRASIPAVILRLAAVYGAGMKGNYARLLRALQRHRFIPVGPGTNRRTLVYEHDAARALLLAARHPAALGQTYNVSDGSIHSFAAIIAVICQALSRRPPRYRLPLVPLRASAALLEDALSVLGWRMPIGRATFDKLTEDVAISGERIQRELGFQPHYDLATGWRETVKLLGLAMHPVAAL